MHASTSNSILPPASGLRYGDEFGGQQKQYPNSMHWRPIGRTGGVPGKATASETSLNCGTISDRNLSLTVEALVARNVIGLGLSNKAFVKALRTSLQIHAKPHPASIESLTTGGIPATSRRNGAATVECKCDGTDG